ncbi:hypothetical protein [Cedecea davisae]|uniref:hypothetical protein n=1 Tax=Cedecea davisae TaxID=158484 RepID=UPI00242B3909|nr:hypothetical protein [Cedecea davisae]
MTKQLEALIADLLRSAVKIGAEKWVSSNGEVTTDDYEVDGVTYTDHICNCEVVNGESPRAEFIAKANPAVVMVLIAVLEKSQQHNKELQVKLDATEAVALALRDDTRGGEKRVAELESTLELEREKSRRVMSQNHQLEASPLAVKLPDLVNFDDLDANSQDREVVESIAQCKGWNAAIEASRRMNDAGGTVELLKQAAPHMLADESLKDPGGVLCGKARSVPDGWVMVPIEPTEDMIVEGFESEPDETFSEPEVWEAYAAMSGCQQAAHRAKLCWSAMIAAAPKPE